MKKYKNQNCVHSEKNYEQKQISMSQELLVSLSEVSVYYDVKPVLEHANLSIFFNDFIGIIGPNGGGKTTLLKVILGLLKPFSGNVIYGEKFSISQIGYLPQRSNVDNQFPITVNETVLSGLMNRKKMFGWFTQKERQLAEMLMESVNIKYLKYKNVNQLSGGEFQKMMLCRAIISNPKLLILDEPNTYTDHNFEAEICQILTELNKKMAIVMVSHDLGIISGMVKTIACVNGTIGYHTESSITPDMMKVYGCPIDLITHGMVPHRVLEKH